MPTKNKVLMVLILIMLGILLVFVYLIYQAEQASTPTPISTSQIKESKFYPKDLAGKVYLTLKEKNSEKQGIYYFNLAKNELVEIYTSQNCEIIGGGLNSIGDKMVYSSNCEQENQDHYQTFLMDLNIKSRKALNETKGGIEKGAVFSVDDKQIVNMSSVKTEDEVEFANWFVFTDDMEGNAKFVATDSTQPVFSEDNNKILGLRKDGLYLYDVENQQGKIVLSLEKEKNHLNLNYDLADKKNKLVIFDDISENKRMIIYEIDSWSDLVLNEIEKIEFSQDEIISYPQFNSVNDKYVIVKKINSKENKAELIVYNTETKENYSVLDLNRYESSQILINDWK